MINWIGSVATAVFAVSYFCRQPKMLRMVQAIATLMWATYGSSSAQWRWWWAT